jgi:hypothetical protein
MHEKLKVQSRLAEQWVDQGNILNKGKAHNIIKQLKIKFVKVGLLEYLKIFL